MPVRLQGLPRAVDASGFRGCLGMPWIPRDAVQSRGRVGPVQATSTGLHLCAPVQPFCRCPSEGVNWGNPKVSPEPWAARGKSHFHIGRSGTSSLGDVAVVGMERCRS